MSLNEIIIILCFAVVLWWPIGGFINRRRGQAWLEWLQRGVKELGATSTNQWLRAFKSVGQLTVKDLRPPFKSLNIIFTLENRDNVIMWVFRHLRGRRDEMIVQAEMRGDPIQELEIGARGRQSYDIYLARQKENPFTELGEQDGFRIARRGQADLGTIERLRTFLSGEGKAIQRMSLQRAGKSEPRLLSAREDKNLLLRASMTRMDTQSPAAFFAALREWAASVAVVPGPVDE